MVWFLAQHCKTASFGSRPMMIIRLQLSLLWCWLFKIQIKIRILPLFAAKKHFFLPMLDFSYGSIFMIMDFLLKPLLIIKAWLIKIQHLVLFATTLNLTIICLFIATKYPMKIWCKVCRLMGINLVAPPLLRHFWII